MNANSSSCPQLSPTTTMTTTMTMMTNKTMTTTMTTMTKITVIITTMTKQTTQTKSRVQSSHSHHATPLLHSLSCTAKIDISGSFDNNIEGHANDNVPEGFNTWTVQRSFMLRIVFRARTRTVPLQPLGFLPKESFVGGTGLEAC